MAVVVISFQAMKIELHPNNMKERKKFLPKDKTVTSSGYDAPQQCP
jgi:hypothetical protein